MIDNRFANASALRMKRTTVKILCPHCHEPLDKKFLYASVGQIAGAVKGKTKKKGAEEMRRIALLRWQKRKVAKKLKGSAD